MSALAQNTAGVYEVAADGTIGDVRILYDNANAVAAGACSVDLGVVEAGRRLGFFLIQVQGGRPRRHLGAKAAVLSGSVKNLGQAACLSRADWPG